MQRVVVEISSKLNRDDFKIFYDASFDVTWQINPIHLQAPFQQRKRDGGPYLDSCLPDYIDQVRKHHNKLFIVKLDKEIGFDFSKKDVNLIFKFLQPRETFAS